MSFNDAYLRWRNQTRKFKRDSMLGGALRTLRQQHADKFEALRAAPWLTCLLVKWVCQDRMLDHGTGADITPAELAQLRQLLWELPDNTELGIGPRLPLYLFMRQILRAQVGFQRRFSRGFVREAAILAQLPSNDPLRVLFETKAGLTVQAFLDLSLLMSFLVMGGFVSLTSDIFEPLSTEYPLQCTKAFIGLISRDLTGLITFCRSLPNANAKKSSEFHEFPALTRYPFLAVNGRLECWHPQVYLRGVEGLVHAVLSESGQAYTDRFGKTFEQHVLNDARTVGAAFFEEQELKAWLPSESEVPDGLLSYPECNIFIEAKSGIFDESVMTVGNSDIYKHKTKAIRKAVLQAWQASVALRVIGEAPAQICNSPNDYLLIVTNKELSAGGGVTLAKVYPPGTLDAPDADALTHLPLHHIYVVSIEDFERLIAGARNGHLDLPKFLADCVALDRDSATSSFLFEQHLSKRQIPMGFSAVVETAYCEAEARVRAAIVRLDEARGFVNDGRTST